MENTSLLLQHQFGDDPNGKTANRAIWDYFATSPGDYLGLSDIKRIASRIDVNVDDVLSVVSMLMGHQGLLRMIYYQRKSPEKHQIIPVKDVMIKLRSWLIEHQIDDEGWNEWAGRISVGWEPIDDKRMVAKVDEH